MTPPSFRRALGAGALLLVAGSAGAQTSKSYAQSRAASNPTECVLYPQATLGSSASSCSTVGSNSYGDAVGIANNGARSVSARSRSTATQAGPNDGFYSGATIYSAIYIGGHVPGANLVFHFLTSASNPISSSGAWSNYQLWFSGGTGAQHDWSRATTYPNHVGTASRTAGVTAVAGGLDFMVPLGGFGDPSNGYGNVFNYVVEATTAASQYQYPNAGDFAEANMHATLAGIDLVDSQGGLIESATFAADGVASLAVVTTTPEPASMALFGTGLLGMFALRAGRRFRRSVQGS